MMSKHNPLVPSAHHQGRELISREEMFDSRADKTVMQPSETLTITVDAASRLLGISKNAAYRAIARGEIPSIRLGRRIVISRRGLTNMIDGK
jgi:excisionase family DNA binding protein